MQVETLKALECARDRESRSDQPSYRKRYRLLYLANPSPDLDLDLDL